MLLALSPRQIHWLAFGLQFFDAVFIVPVFQCFFISVSIFGGGVYFKEFSKMSTLAVRSSVLPPHTISSSSVRPQIH